MRSRPLNSNRFMRNVMRNKLYLKKSDRVRLCSEHIDAIFLDLKYHNASFNEIQENFLFLLPGVSFLEKEILIPEHQKYLRFKTIYSNFKELFDYFNQNKDLLPFKGVI